MAQTVTMLAELAQTIAHRNTTIKKQERGAFMRLFLYMALDISSLFVYTSTMSSVLKNRTAYVVYVPTKGYMKNKACEFHEEFAQARLFSTEKSANDSIDMNRKLKKIGKLERKRNIEPDTPAFVIPVEMTLDPRKLFKTVLQGKK
jgi:hypothetical protein